MNLRSATYVTAKEVRNRALNDKTGFENENNVTTNSNSQSEADFDSNDSNEFDPILSGNYDARDDFMDVE
jgi:hypothetical protein